MATEDRGSLLTWPDYVVIAGYFLFVLAVGLWVSSVQKQIRSNISHQT